MGGCVPFDTSAHLVIRWIAALGSTSAYREFARVLEPWLYHEKPRQMFPVEEDVRRWERRFLD